MNRSMITRRYREAAICNASQVELVVMMYDMIIEDLYRAAEAINDNDVEKRAAETRHILAVLEQLQGTLVMEQGGDAAVNMDRLYSITRAKLLEANMKNSASLLDELRALFTDLRAAWTQVENKDQPQVAQATANNQAFCPASVSDATIAHDWTA